MKDYIINELTNKKILILGFGREGRSTYKFIKENKIRCNVTIADIYQINDIDIINDGVELHTGEDYLDGLDKYDLVIKSPGVSLKDIDISEIRDKITSQTEIFLKYAGTKTIGVTGTKGKSTTSSMIYSLLKNKYKVELVGNIGVPVLEIVDEYENTDWYVYELSSHQLELVRHSPHIAVFLNIYPEHLDYYLSYESYINAKKNIYKYQSSEDLLIYNGEIEDLINNDNVASKTIVVKSKEIKGENNYSYFDSKTVTVFSCGDEKTIHLPQINNIIGEHNKTNLSVAITVASNLGMSEAEIIIGIGEFKSLPHRMEKIGKFSEVTFYDDSIATIPQATEYAIESIENVDTVLIGGMDRGIAYDDFAKYLARCKVTNIIFMYESGKKIYEKLKKMKTANNLYYEETLEGAVKRACEVTSKGKSCILSPAAASYGEFKNFEERGEKYKGLIIKYCNE